MLIVLMATGLVSPLKASAATYTVSVIITAGNSNANRAVFYTTGAATVESTNLTSGSDPSLYDEAGTRIADDEAGSQHWRYTTTSGKKYYAGTFSHGAAKYMLNMFGFNDNIIIGKPVEIIYSDQDVSFSKNEGHIEYLFQVTNNLTGNELPEYISVRSQLGNIFEIGDEYCISPIHLNNTLFDKHIIYMFSQFIEAGLITRKDADHLRNRAAEKAKDFTVLKPVTERASPTADFISSVDLAIEITVTEKHKEKDSGNIVDVVYNLNDVLRGKRYEHLLPEFLRLNSNVEVGGTYMILLDVINDEYVLPAARNGSVIQKDSSDFRQYENVLSESTTF